MAGLITAYLERIAVKGCTSKWVAEVTRHLNRVVSDCRFERTGDLSAEAMDGWLAARTAEGQMGASTRNAYLGSLKAFAAWLVRTGRIPSNPFAANAKANVAADRRHERRALSAEEFGRLLYVATWRPLARAAWVRDERAAGRLRFETVTYTTLDRSVAAARRRLAGHPAMVVRLERIGKARSLLYQVLGVTGLRKTELASVTVARARVDASPPHLLLAAAAAKNRQEARLPLGSHLAGELRDWLDDRRNRAGGTLPPTERLFRLGLHPERNLDKDLAAAGVPKRDDLGRVIDLHALRGTLATRLNCAGVAPRVAQEAMRHSDIRLTMQVYTDRRLLDVAAAIESLPPLLPVPPD